MVTQNYPFRMRILASAFALACFVHITQAQDSGKTWIFLTDKLDAAGKVTQAEVGYISDRAMTRRRLRGTSGMETQFAWQDAPVSDRYEAALAAHGIRIEQRSRWLNAVTAWLSENELDLVRSLPFVRGTRPVAGLAPDQIEEVPIALVVAPRSSKSCTGGGGIYGPSCNQLDMVNAIPLLERGINGEGVVLGFLDTRFGTSEPFSHPSLVHIRTDGRFREWRDFACNQGHLHGMNVASVAVGYVENQIIGPGHKATVYAATTECVSYERNVEEDSFVAGTEWMVSEGVDVLNSSLGYATFDTLQHSYSISDLDGDTGLTTMIYDWAAARGVVPVTSAGNSGLSSWGRITMPADGDSVIAIGGVRPNRSYWPASGRGPTADGRTKPDVSAQSSGVYLATGNNGYGSSGGTSFSAPMVAGIVTQILQANPELTPIEVRDVLRQTASQAASPDNQLGWGIVNADEAVKLAIVLDREEAEVPNPDAVTVHAPYPNPFRSSTHFSIETWRPISYARLTIYNVIGQEVAVPYEGALGAGSHEITFEAAALPSGLYMYMVETNHERHSGTMVLVH